MHRLFEDSPLFVIASDMVAFKRKGIDVSVKRGLCKAIASSATKAQCELYLEEVDQRL